MDAQQFLAEFRHIANGPRGINRLRELILTLAVSGQLVPQSQRESINFGDIPGIKGESLIGSLALPDNWRWAYFRQVLDFQGGGQPPKNVFSPIEREGHVQLIQIRDLGDSPQPVFIPKALAAKFCTPEDILIGRYGASVGKVFWGKHGAYNVALVKMIDLHGLYEKRFLFLLLKSPIGQSLFGGISRSAQDGFNKRDIENKLVPVVPLNEQSRIVAKVDELMALCDKLEAQQQDRRTLQNALRQSTLQAVASAQSPHELQITWTRLSENFGRLFSAPEDVVELRNLILDLAVHGLLVEQSTSDAPISEWVASVAGKKANLFKQKLIAKQTAFVDLDESEYPFPLPTGWVFVRLGQITNKIGSGSTPRGGREVYVKEGIPFLRSQNVWNDGLRLSEVAYITPEMHKGMSGTAVLGNDILLNITGASLGRCALVPTDFGDANVSQHVTIIRPTDPQVREYLHLCLLSPYAQAMIWGRQVGMAREGLSKKVLEQFEIPLPPIAEQKRIVTRVSELMRYCDVLEAHLLDANKLAERLAASAVATLTGIAIEQEEDQPVKAPQTELIAPLRLGHPPDIKAQAPLATLLARYNGEMSAKDLWQRFGGEIDAFYAQLKAEVAHGWIQEPEPGLMREVQTANEGT